MDEAEIQKIKNQVNFELWRERMRKGSASMKCWDVYDEMEAVIERLQKERDEWKDLATKVAKIRKDRDEWKAKAERWAKDFEGIKQIAEDERTRKLKSEEREERLREANERLKLYLNDIANPSRALNPEYLIDRLVNHAKEALKGASE